MYKFFSYSRLCYLLSICLCLGTTFFTKASSRLNAGVDLSITISSSVDTVGVFTYFVVNYQVTNQGTDAATGITAFIPQPEGFAVYEGGNEVSPVSTIFEPTSATWTIGTLNAGQSIWVQVSFYATGLGTAPFYAQILTCNEPDTDSAPSNGTPFWTVNEDDEALDSAVIVPQYCNLTPTIVSADCNNFGTPTDPNDDLVVMLLNVNSNLLFSGNWLGCSIPPTYHPDGTVTCEGNQLSGPFDQETGISVPASLSGQIVYLSPAFNNSVFSSCTTTLLIPDVCEEVPIVVQAPDLNLKIHLSDSATLVNGRFLLHAFIRNLGNATATGVEVKVTLPEGVAYRTNIEPYITTDGSIFDTTSGIWTIGTMLPGDTIRLKLRMRRYNVDTLCFYGEVVAENEVDKDSEPNNGIVCESHEDDDGFDGMSPTLPVGTDDIISDWFGVYPNPANQNLVVNTHGNIINRYIVYDIIGRELLKLGGESSNISVADLSAGHYVLVAQLRDGRRSSARFQVAR